jgi:hypothetical protein
VLRFLTERHSHLSDPVRNGHQRWITTESQKNAYKKCNCSSYILKCLSPVKENNQYFVLLKTVKWQKKEWDGPLQYVDPEGELMMLPTDMALLDDAEFKKWVDVYAKDKKVFFDDFASAFGKMLELGVVRQKI